MSWQLWAVIALIAAGVVILIVTRMRHAQHVFADITRLDHPAEGRQAGPSGDEIARARARAMARERGAEPATGRRRRHG